MLNEHLFIVFAVEHYNTLGLIRSIGEYGIAPIYIAIKGKARLASTSKYISRCHFVDSPEAGYEVLLREYGSIKNEGKLPFVFCIDDKTVSYMDERYEQLKGRFLFFNAGQPGRINEFMDKLNILNIAQKHGLKVLKAYRCKNGEIPEDISYPVITKSISPTIGGWKSDVHVCADAGELQAAYKVIEAPVVLVQEYIQKKNEYCLEGFSVANGSEMFISIASTYNYLLPNYYSPYMTVANMENEEIRGCLGKVIKEIGFEGIFEIEFLVGQDDTLYFGEINFRNSTWSYASTVAGMNIPCLWAEGMLEGKVPEQAYKSINVPFTAMVEPIDYQKRVVEREMDVKEWVVDLLGCKCWYYFNKEDMEPFFEMVRNNEKLR